MGMYHHIPLTGLAANAMSRFLYITYSGENTFGSE